jgi:hypothetical protein
MKIVFFTKDPASGPLRGTAGREFFEFVHRSAALRSPFVAAAIIVSDGESCNNPCNRAEYNDVHKKYFTLKAKRTRGFTPL